MQTALTTAQGFPPLPAFGKGQQLLCYVCLVFLHNEDILDRSISGMTPIKCDKRFFDFMLFLGSLTSPEKKSPIIGFIIGPLLFVLYINDICDVCTSFMKLYADDAKYKVKTRCTFPSE